MIRFCSSCPVWILSVLSVHSFSLSLWGAEPESTMVSMDDGVKLLTRIWKPKEPGKYPVVLTRAYSAGYGSDWKRFTQSGYVYVGQATRGGGGSDGSRFFHDAKDGYSTLTWIAKQPWCNGQIAMYGRSYWGITQWLVAPERHPNLKAIVPQACSADGFRYGYRANGALTLAMCANGRAFTGTPKVGWKKFFRSLPLIDLDRVGRGRENKLWNDYVRHSTFDDFWKKITIRSDGGDGKDRKIRIPVYLHGGWFDYYPGQALTRYRRLRDLGATKEIRVLIGATEHLGKQPAGRRFPGGQKKEIEVAIRWLDHVLKGKDNGMKDEPPVQIFVMGINKWRGEQEWPLARTKLTKYYFHSENGSRKGTLRTKPPGNEKPTSYAYDPDKPCPTLGGSHSFLKNLPGLIQAGSVDQRANESREDVLVFSTPPLPQDTEVTGPVEIRLYAATSARDTDFTAKLLDVYPDGAAYNLSEGIIRARFRKSIYKAPELLTPGKIYEYRLELLPTANVFKKGHRIRIHLSSSNWPLWDRNPNTGNPQGLDAKVQVAQQTIYHDRDRPSHIVLPIIPKRR